MIAMLLYVAILGGFTVLLLAALSAFKEAVKTRARLRGILLTIGVALLSLAGCWAMLV